MIDGLYNFLKISKILVQKRKLNLNFFERNVKFPYGHVNLTRERSRTCSRGGWMTSIYGILISPTPGWPEIEFYIKLYRHCSALYIYLFFLPVVILEPLRTTTCLQNKNQKFGFYSNKISVLLTKFSVMLKNRHLESKLTFSNFEQKKYF